MGIIGSSLAEAGLFLQDGTAVSFDAMFNRPLAISLTLSIRSTHFFALL